MAFLPSEDAACLTCQVTKVDGGLTAVRSLISDRPLLTMGLRAQWNAVCASMHSLPAGAAMYQFTYMTRRPIAPEILARQSLRAEWIGTAIFNLPPPPRSIESRSADMLGKGIQNYCSYVYFFSISVLTSYLSTDLGECHSACSNVYEVLVRSGQCI